MERYGPGFRHSAPADFRASLGRDDHAVRLLGLALARLKEAGLVRAAQRTGSPRFLAAVRDLTRLNWSLRSSVPCRKK
ncbi:hypothetical protein [Streptomyces sp. WG5]|uniref:hypothetical protein n=1 Tax=Streptomyces sp. WG5 TaxID=3417648 RepID=UPI003CF7B3D9